MAAPAKIFKVRQHRLDFSKKTYIMGVLNVTPDSFSNGGRFLKPNLASARALQMEKEGADIIDIGGESTRPGSCGISTEEEIRRVIPVLKKLKKRLKVPISVDTTKALVAEASLEEGASIINDISGLRSDKRIASLCVRYSAGVVVMHMKGRPRTMQKGPSYRDLLGEIVAYLKKSVDIAKAQGLKKEQIIIDPGIGFGKTPRHNLMIIQFLRYFKRLGLPVMIGLSRKSFMGRVLGLDVTERLVPTVVANTVAIYNGADIIRVHDVKEAVMAARLVDEIKNRRGHIPPWLKLPPLPRLRRTSRVRSSSNPMG